MPPHLNFSSISTENRVLIKKWFRKRLFSSNLLFYKGFLLFLLWDYVERLEFQDYEI